MKSRTTFHFCLEYIDSIRNRRSKKPLLTDDNVVAKLKELHQSLVVVPTDKAANNVSIILPKTKKFGCGGRGDLTLLFKSCEIDKSQGRLVY